jgi:Fic family protein
MKKYIEEIQKILAKTGWSQSRFAQEIGVSFATVNRWLKGHTTPHMSQTIHIERLFKKIVGIEPKSQTQIKKIMEEIEKNKRKFKIKEVFKNQNIIEEFIVELTYNSDAIEGSTLTKKETEAIIFDKTNVREKSLVEHLEAVNHASILRDIFLHKIIPPIEEETIKSLHENLMRGIREDAGFYSRHQRGIRGVDLILPHPEDIPEEMRLYISKVNVFKINPIEHIAKMHSDFEAIHPFGDGNGRIGRLIMIMQLIAKGYCPCLINVKEKNKYYEYLEYAQKKSATHLIYFTAEAVLKGYDIIKKYSSF